MQDVFISYSSIDQAAADRICHYLEQRGINCWIAHRNIEPGEIWSDAIVQAIHSTRVFILVYSHNSNASKQVMNELTNAFSAGSKIIPFRLDMTPMSPSLSYYLHSVHWLNAAEFSVEEKLAELYSIIKTALAAPKDQATGSWHPWEKQPKPKKKNRVRLWICLAVALYVLVYSALISGFIHLRKNAPQDIPMECISNFDGMSYPGGDLWLLSGDGKQLVLQDQKTKELVSLDVSRPYITLWEAEYDLQDPLATRVIQTEENPYVYVWDDIADTVSIFHKDREEWIAEKIHVAGLNESEFSAAYIYQNPHLQVDRTDSQGINLLFYDTEPAESCFSHSVRMSADGNYSMISLSDLNMKKMICVFDIVGEAMALMMDENDYPVIVNLVTGEIVTRDLEEICTRYMPDAVDNTGIVSPGKRYIISEGDGVGKVWDLETGYAVFSWKQEDYYYVHFLDDSRIIYYSRNPKGLYTVDLREKNPKAICLLDRNYFETGKNRNDIVADFYYSREHNYCFFLTRHLTEYEEAVQYRLKMTDLEGNILAQSDHIYIDSELVEPYLLLAGDALLAVLPSWNFNEPVKAQDFAAIYRTMLVEDAEGNLRFESW